MYTLSFFGPVILSACVSGIVNSVIGDGNSLVCNIERSKPQVTKYDPKSPENSCYRDGIFYPRCKDLENPEVLRYHNLLKAENDKLR